MRNLKLKVIFKYLKPYKREFLYGGIALLVVNILSVLIPLEVKNIIDKLKDEFSSSSFITKSLWTFTRLCQLSMQLRAMENARSAKSRL